MIISSSGLLSHDFLIIEEDEDERRNSIPEIRICSHPQESLLFSHEILTQHVVRHEPVWFTRVIDNRHVSPIAPELRGPELGRHATK
jgi:hypothetical protein